ncbi:MAG: carbohydrate ABC transporter permease [Acidimicrobiales bacterium]|nr:MAG: carbohydrate ABC transporter permease [Acidimicrobiales bacterium]
MRRYRMRTFFGEIAMLVVCAIFLIPIYFLAVSSFKTQPEMLESPLGLPTRFDFSNYGRALEGIDFFRHFWISVYITSVSVVLIVIFGSMAAYTIARRTNRLTRLLRNYFLIGFMVPLQTTMLPLFLIMRSLNLLNTMQGLIFLHTNGAVFAVFLYTGFMRAMPRDLEEAAAVDGAGTYRIFWKIVFPLLKPVTATIVIFNTIWIWNDFILGFLFLGTADDATLTMQVYNGVGQFQNDWGLMIPMLVITTLPMVIFFLVMQKRIIGGLTAGSLRG